MAISPAASIVTGDVRPVLGVVCAPGVEGAGVKVGGDGLGVLLESTGPGAGAGDGGVPQGTAFRSTSSLPLAEW